jgi:hypothetical protein
MNRTQIYFTEEEHKFLKREAYEKDISMAEVIRAMVDEAMKKEKEE